MAEDKKISVLIDKIDNLDTYIHKINTTEAIMYLQDCLRELCMIIQKDTKNDRQ